MKELLDNEEWISSASVLKRFPDFSSSPELMSLVKLGKIRSRTETRITKGRPRSTYFLHKVDVIQCAQLLKELKDNYYNLNQLAHNLGNKKFDVRNLSNSICAIKNLCLSEGMEFIEFDTSYIALRFFIKSTDFLSFRKKYITAKEAAELFDATSETIYRIPDVKRLFFRTDNIPLYSKEDLARAFAVGVRIQDYAPCRSREKSVAKVISLDDYYSSEEVLSILGFDIYDQPANTWRHFRREFGISPVLKQIAGRYDYYEKNNIDTLKLKQLEYRNDYYTMNEAIEKIGISHFYHYGIQLVKANALIRAAFGIKSLSGIFPKTEIDSFAEKYLIKTELDQIDYKGSLLEAFDRRFKVMDAPCEANSETNKAWFIFCKNKLKKAEFNKNLEARRNNVNYYVDCTLALFRVLQSRELPSMGATEINFSLLRASDLCKRRRGILYTFCVTRYHQVKGKEPVLFKPDQLHYPNDELPETKRDTGIYQFDEYQKLLAYATDLSIHKQKAIEDTLNKINNNKTTDYASAWLYVLTSLNNAWRHPDIVYNLTQLDLERLKIQSIDELMDKDITLDQARIVIAQIMAKDKSHTKTSATAQFNCSDDLAIPLATAAIICTLISQKLHLGKEIVCFSNKDNKFLNSISDAFFEDLDVQLDFKIQKINRSLLTYTYLILIQKGYGGAALEVAKRLRGHYGFETTNLYLKIPQEMLDKLVIQLFARRNFGYIQHTFLNVLYGSEPNHEKRTNEILSLNSKFDVHQVMATSGFLMKVNAERQTVMEKILTMGLDEAKELMFKISSNLLPSKERHVQCLISEINCEYPQREKCRNCSYAIPNFYIITSIVQSFTDLCQQLGNAYRSGSETQKIKLRNLLHTEIALLQEASDTFGYEVVMPFFQGDEEGYEILLSSLDDVFSLETYNFLTSS